MFACEYVFPAREASKRKREVLQDAIEGLLGGLWKNGQIYGRCQVIGWADGACRVMCYVSRPDALDPSNHSSWASEDYRKVLALCAEAPSYRLIEVRAHPKRFPAWQKAESLYLFAKITSPLSSGKDGEAVPLYMLPLTDIQREHLMFWNDAHHYADGLWLHSGALEMAAYREMADPNSDLSQEGRELCREVEEATDLPTYYYLVRYWGRSQGEMERRCPGCGGIWAQPQTEDGIPWRLSDFDFRCESCRLVGHAGLATEDERHARVGEYREHRKRSQRRSALDMNQGGA